eukprot:gene195-202_t
MNEVEIIEDDDGATYDFVEVLQNSLWISSPEYAGWLLKRSSNWFVNKSLLLRGHAWARKWVSLHGTELVYMDKEPTLDNMRRIKVRRAQITASTAITNDETEPTQFYINFNIEHTPEWQFRAESVEEKNNWIVKLCQVHAITLWLDEYDRVKVLGIGGQGTVYELVHRKTGKHLAMKEMEIKSDKQMQLAIAEAVFLKKIVETVCHPNIMRIEKVFQVGSRFYLAFPLCTGGELFDAIVDRGHFSEHDAAVIIHDLISALHALHAHDILHLDIKPENILFANKDIDSRILLTDFGLSKVFSEEESKFHASIEDHEIFQKNFQKHLELYIENGDLDEKVSIRGTNGYISPEIIIDGYYSKAADVFASGVVLYILLCGYAPFAGRSTRQTFLKTVKGKYKMTGVEWESVSEEAKDLVKKMLVVDPFDRITTEEILNHPWIVAAGPFPEVVQPPEFLSPISAESVHKSAKPVDPLPQPPNAIPVVVTPTPPITVAEQPKPVEHVDVVEVVPTEKQDSVLSDSSSITRANKPSALSQLANHVQYLKTEKMAATMTKLFSLQGQQVGHSRLADKYLIPVHLDQFPNEKLEQAPVENLTFLVNDEMRRAISSAIFESFGSHRNKITLEEFGIIRKKFAFLPFSASTVSSGSTPSGASNLNVNLGEILLANLMDRNHDGFITIEDIYNFQVLLMHKNEVYLQAVFRVYLEALWYPGKNLNYLNTVQHMNLKGKDSEPVESTAKETPPEVNASGKLAGLLDSFSGKRRPSKGKDQEVKFDVVEPPKFITAKNVAVIFEKFGYDPKHAETVFNVLCETLQRIRLGAKPVQETPKDGKDAEENLAVEKEEISENTSVRNVRRHRMDVNDFVRACRIDDVLIQVLYRQQHQKLYSLIEKAKRRFIEEKERQARLPTEERKQVTLEAVVHDVLQQAIADKVV